MKAPWPIRRWRLRWPVQWEVGTPACRDCGLHIHVGVHEPVRDCEGPFLDGPGDERVGYCTEPSEHHPYRPVRFRDRRTSSSFWWPD